MSKPILGMSVIVDLSEPLALGWTISLSQNGHHGWLASLRRPLPEPTSGNVNEVVTAGGPTPQDAIDAALAAAPEVEQLQRHQLRSTVPQPSILSVLGLGQPIRRRI